MKGLALEPTRRWRCAPCCTRRRVRAAQTASPAGRETPGATESYTANGYTRWWYNIMSVAIRTFKRSEIANFFLDGRLERRAGWVRIAKVVTRKLDMIHYAQRLDDLRSPPANRLEALKGDVAGFQSVRVNNQWRIVFRWTDDGAVDVDVTDYHG